MTMMTSPTTTNLCLYHAADGKDWAHYLAGLLSKRELDLTVSTFDGSSKCEIKDSEHKQNIVRVLLISPEFLPYIATPLPIWFPKDMKHPIIGILCSVELSEISRDVDSSTWTIFTLEDTAVPNLIKNIAAVVDAYETKLMVEPPRPLPPVPTPRKPKSPAPPSQPLNTVLVPSISKHRIQRAFVTKKSNSEDEVFIVFHDEQSTEENIEVEIKDVKIVPKRLNPYTLVFKPPDNLQGKVLMYVCQGNQVSNSYPLLFESVDFSSLSYINLLAQSLRIQPDDIETLDQKLLQIFNKSVPSDESHSIFSNIKADYNDTVDRSKNHLPTLLHFAAANGLKELSCRLLELPGSLIAYQLENCQGHDPACLADRNGHHDLAEYLRNYVETQITVDIVDDLYVEMKGHSLLYENTKPRPERHVDQEMYTVLHNPLSTIVDDDDIDESLFMDGLKTKLVPERLPKKDVKRTQSDGAPQRKASDDRQPLPLSSTLPAGHCFAFETPSRGVVGSSSLEELKQIQIMFADGKFSIDRAQQLFAAWKMRYGGSTPSFKDRQKTLAALRETFKDTFKKVEQTKKKSVFGKLLQRVRTKEQSNKGPLEDKPMNITLPHSRSRTRLVQQSDEISNDCDRLSGSSGYSSGGGMTGCRSSGETDDLVRDEATNKIQRIPFRNNPDIVDSKQATRMSRRIKALQDSSTWPVKKTPPVPPYKATRLRAAMPPPPPRR